MLDTETQQILKEGSQIRDFVDSDAWKNIKKRLVDKLATLTSIDDIITTDRSQEELKLEIEGRRLVKLLLLGWIAEIEGDAEQYEANKVAFEAWGGDRIIKSF